MTRLSDKLEAAMKAGTQGEWGTRRAINATGDIAIVSSAGIVGEFFAAIRTHDEISLEVSSNAEQIVLLHNNLPTIIAALRERGE